MAKKNTTIEAGKRSKDWPEFMARLSEVLGKLDEDQYLVINVKKSNRYVQFAGQGRYGLRAETASRALIRYVSRSVHRRPRRSELLARHSVQSNN